MPAEDEAPDSSLREQVYQSGRYLVARQLIGMALRVAGILVLTRLIGPEAYGLFAGPAALMGVLSTIAIFGLDVHAIRFQSVDRTVDDTIFTLLALFSIVVSVGAVLAAPLFGDWLGDDGVVGPMRFLAVLLPIVVLSVPARARLERELAFRQVAGLELVADLIVYLVALPLAFAGAGVWAPVGGFAARHVWLLGSTHVAARYRPRLAFSTDQARLALRFGAGYSTGRWVSVAADLVNPLLVGRVLGPIGVGYVGLASRLVEQLSAVKAATLRLATIALARMVDDVGRLRAAHAEGMLVQTLGTVPLLATAAFLGPWFVPIVFGREWEPLAELLALIGIAASVGTLFNLHAQTLNVLGRNAPVARLRVLQLVSLVGATLALVPWLGASGYGVARVARTVPFVVIHRDLGEIFKPVYRPAVRWLVGLLPLMGSPWLTEALRPLLLLPLVAIVLRSTARDELRVMWRRAVGQGANPSAPA